MSGGRTECAPPQKRAVRIVPGPLKHASVRVRVVFGDAQSAFLRKILPSRTWGSTREASLSGAHPRGGVGSACPHGKACAKRRRVVMKPPSFRLSTTGDKIPQHADGLATRARRPRPSEKIASRVISGLSRVGDRRCARPRRGGAGSASPQRYPGEDPGWMRGSCSSGVSLTHGVLSPSIFQGNFILGSGQGRSCLVP